MQQQVELGTADALRIAAMSTAAFRTAVDKGDYVSAPPAVKGRRVWTLDQMVVLAWFNALVMGGLKRNMAGGMAAELTKAIDRDPTAEAFSVFMWEDPDGERGRMAIGGPEPPAEAPNAQLVLVMPLAEWRAKVSKAVDNYLQRKAARRAR